MGAQADPPDPSRGRGGTEASDAAQSTAPLNQGSTSPGRENEPSGGGNSTGARTEFHEQGSTADNEVRKRSTKAAGTGSKESILSTKPTKESPRVAEQEPQSAGGVLHDTNKSPHRVPFLVLFDEFVTNVGTETKEWEKLSSHDRQLMQEMFSAVFVLHEQQDLPAEKEHLPTLVSSELDCVMKLFWAEVFGQGATCQQWKNRLRDLTKSIYESPRSLMDTIELRLNSLKARPTTSTNPWELNPLVQGNQELEDEPMEEADTIIRFRTDVYKPDEIEEMRAAYMVDYDFPTKLREPTELERKITQGLLEGNILAQGLPQFLKRTCDNDLLRVIQNTIYVQVEGELFFQLPAQFPVYPDFQTRDRLVGAILQGAKRIGFDQNRLTEMLGETKQVCYNPQQHSVHLFFWTRESSSKWSQVFKSIPFRNRRFLLVNPRPMDGDPRDTPAQRRSRTWGRQVGLDGIRNEQRHERYRVKLLNVSRFMDEATLDAFIRSKFNGSYVTFQEPKYGRQIFQTGVWEIYFRSPACPKFLEKIRFINWMGTKILVHHVGTNPAPPCYNCGVPGHTVAQCRAQPDAWSRGNSCIAVSSQELAHVERRKSTVTSIEELENMWGRLNDNHSRDQDTNQRRQTAATETTKEGIKTSAPCHPMEAPASSSDWKIPPRSKTFRPGKTASEGYKMVIQEDTTNKTQKKKKEVEVVDLVESVASDEEEELEEKAAPSARVFLPRSAALTKQNRLIIEAIHRNQTRFKKEDANLVQSLDLEKLDPETGFSVLQNCGLSPIETPKTGNCQFYAVAMAMLNKQFHETADISAIENMTVKLKKGIQIAALQGFEAEFPHGMRQEILKTLDENAGVLNAPQSETRLKEYIQDVCTSSSSRTAFISKSLWGTDLTLKMLSKLLQRPIYVVVGHEGLAKPTFQVFKPIHKATPTHALESGGEFNYAWEKAKSWMAQLQQDCHGFEDTGKLPIVLFYGSQHYTWLKLGETPSNELLEELVTSPARVWEHEHDQDVEMSSDETDFKEQKPCTVSQHDIEKNGFKKNYGAFSVGEREELREVTLHGGERKEELRAFPTQGPHGLSPGKQKMLVNVDWEDDEQVNLLVNAIGETKDTLHEWQARLEHEGFDSVTSPDENDIDMGSSDTSDYTPDDVELEHGADETRTRAATVPVDPPDGQQTRFSSGNGRRSENIKRDEWNALEANWNDISTLPFPRLPVDKQSWENAVQEHPYELLLWLQRIDSPEYILRALTVNIVMTWTRQLRIDCLLFGLTDLQAEVAMAKEAGLAFDDVAVNSMESWITFIRDQRAEMTDDGYIHSKDLWSSLNKLKPDKVPLLQTCRRSKAEKLARQLLAAYAYAPELALMNGEAEPSLQSLGETLDQFLLALQTNAQVQRAFYGNDSDGDWAALESLLAVQQSQVALSDEMED